MGIYNKNPKFALCIDWETSGASWDGKSWEQYQGVSVGICVVETSTFDIVDTLYLEIKFDPSKFKWSMDAEKVHGLSRDHLEKHGVSREDAAVQIAELILKYFDPQERIYIIGHQTVFDIGFTKELLDSYEIFIEFDQKIIDTAGLGFVLFGIHKSDELFDLMGLPPRTLHNALEDSIYTVMVCQRIREMISGL